MSGYVWALIAIVGSAFGAAARASIERFERRKLAQY